MNAPSRSEVAEKFRELIQESASREEVATWAQKWVIADKPPRMEKDIWDALQFLMSADLISIDRPYLYSTQDFERELSKLLPA